MKKKNDQKLGVPFFPNNNMNLFLNVSLHIRVKWSLRPKEEFQALQLYFPSVSGPVISKSKIMNACHTSGIAAPHSAIFTLVWGKLTFGVVHQLMQKTDVLQQSGLVTSMSSPLSKSLIYVNKPAAQAAGPDPFRCSSTIRQNSPIQQNCLNFWTNTATLLLFKI